MRNSLPVEGTQYQGQVGAQWHRQCRWGCPGSAPPDGQRMPAALWVLCSPCCAAKSWFLWPPAAQPPRQPPHAPTQSSQRRNNLEKPWQPRAALGMPALCCPRVPPPPQPQAALWAAGCCRVGGGTCQHLWAAAPTSPGHRDAHSGLPGLWSSLAQQGCSHRGSLRVLDVPPRCPVVPAAAPAPLWPGVSWDPHVPPLFCSAGMEPPRGPQPAQPTHPVPAAAGPGRTLGRGSLPTSCPNATGMGFLMPLPASPWHGVLASRIRPSSPVL